MIHASRLASIALLAVACAPGLVLAAADSAPKLRVTVTNLTRGQVLSPPVVILHDGSFELFSPGQQASPELAALAEDAASSALLALASITPGVAEASVAGNVVPPGHSISVDLDVQPRARAVTIAGMLVTTNDAFFAADLTADLRPVTRSSYAIAWDSGSEANTESCAHIPGPPCGNGGVRVTEGAEGFVSVHAGVHGGGDLAVSAHDWRNPVALVTVEMAR